MTHRSLFRRTSRTAVTILAAGALMLPAATAFAESPSAPAPNPGPVTVADLADSSAAQQRWLSEPDSRVALNPSHSQTDDTRPKADNSLDTMFYGDQRKRTADGVVRNSFTATDAPTSLAALYDEGDTTPTLSEGFNADSATHWRSTNNGGALTVGAGGGTVAPGGGKDWGAVGRDVVLDVDADPVLLVSVAATTGKWALKIAPDGQPDIVVQTDTVATGTFAYDLKALNVHSGKVTVKLFASNNGTATFRGLSVHARPGLVEDFSDLGAWSTNVQSNNGATIARAASGVGATVTSASSSGFGAVARAVTVNLTDDPVLTVAVGPLSTGSKWALKLTGADGNGDFAVIQDDTDATGVFSYNLAALTGRSGTQTFGIKLFSTKTPVPTSATFTRLSLHGSNDWLQSPSDYTNTWNPQSLDWTGTYGGSGSYSTRDVFVDATTVSRLVTAENLTAGSPTLAGRFSGTTAWDATTRVLTVSADNYTRAVGFPSDAEVLFFDSPGAASRGTGGTAAPASSSTAWVAVLPNDADSAIGLGYAYGTGADAKSAAAASASHGADASVVTAALQSRTDEWNAYLAAVPAVQDYTLHAVSAEGTTGEDIRAMYYRSFVNLKQTVVPPQPESGISHAQVATGKAATYNGGSERNRASASWDSLLGIQYLGYTEPALAWDSLVGMMADVEADGGLNGESLPSRKAQTAWMLYSITGDKDKLAEVYPAIKAHMGWSSEHLAWNIDSHYPGGGVPASQERDAEFVNSLAIDLDYAAESARVLGLDADAASFLALQKTLLAQYQEWFFMPDGRAVQYYWTSKPDATYDQRKGTVNYVGTGLHLPGLTDAETTAIMARFDAEYDPVAQFAGTASDSIKTPDAQFVAYGLIEHGQAQKVQVYLESTLRDITRTNRFSEVYQQGKNPGDAPISRGESPTTFGMAHVIDNLWMLNGYRSDEGTPTFVRLPGATGGVSGLHHLGRSFSIDLDGTQVVLGGDAAAQPGVCDRVDAPEGQPIELTTTCGSLTLSADTVQAGQKVTVRAGKLPATASARIELHSDPVLLDEATTRDDGTLERTVLIPADVPVGRHTIVVTSGVVVAQADITVRAPQVSGGGDGGTTPNTGGGSGVSSGGAGGSGSLASTGGDVVLWAMSGGLGLLVLTVGIVMVARARNRSRAVAHDKNV